MSVEMDRWNELWAAWYRNDDQRAQINSELIEVKNRMLGRGVHPAQPPRPLEPSEVLETNIKPGVTRGKDA